MCPYPNHYNLSCYLLQLVLDAKAKASVKKIIKEFAIYEVYKVMNPRRIAGETKKDNYAHNMMMGGQKRASKYEGGKESDLKSYGEAEVRRIEQASKTFQKGGRGIKHIRFILSACHKGE